MKWTLLIYLVLSAIPTNSVGTVDLASRTADINKRFQKAVKATEEIRIDIKVAEKTLLYNDPKLLNTMKEVMRVSSVCGAGFAVIPLSNVPL